ncbi:MAG: toll/interleukin-1 receptor domain-containing protein [Longimicrobiaceae bacterium]
MWTINQSLSEIQAQAPHQRSSDMPPSVFLSHTAVDKPFVRKLAEVLRLWGCRVWFDEWEIEVGDSIVEKIEHGLAENDFLIVVLSRSSIESRWVRIELNAAFFRQVAEQQIKVVPVLIEDCTVPALIRDIKYADFRTSFEDGLNALLKALGGRGALQLDSVERSWLLEIVEQFGLRVWTDTAHFEDTGRSGARELQRLVDSGLIRVRVGQTFSTLDSGVIEHIYEATERGKKIADWLRATNSPRDTTR